MKKLTLLVMFVLSMAFVVACGGGGGGGGGGGSQWDQFPNFTDAEPVDADESDPDVRYYEYTGMTRADIDSGIQALLDSGFNLMGSNVSNSTAEESYYEKTIDGVDYGVSIEWADGGSLYLIIEVIKPGPQVQVPTSIAVSPTTVALNVVTPFTFTYTPTGSESGCASAPSILGGGTSLSTPFDNLQANVRFTTAGTKTFIITCGGVDFPMTVEVTP